MKTKIAISALGSVVMFTGLWGGAYGMHALPDWASFPSFLTACLFFVGGILIAVSPFEPKS